MDLGDVVLIGGDCVGCRRGCRWLFCETTRPVSIVPSVGKDSAYLSKKRSNWMPKVSAVASTTLGISCVPANCLRTPLLPTISSSAKPSISLCMPGVLTEGGPLGRDDERACRLLTGVASLRGSLGPLSVLMTASTIDAMLDVWFGWCGVGGGRSVKERSKWDGFELSA